MPRSVRIEYAGARYHVMSRGSRRDAIYQDRYDREVFLETLGEAIERTGWLVHAFVLMTNHYHLLLSTPEANLSEGMRWLQGTYGRRYNSRHALSGHVFQGRFKSPVIDDEDPDYFRNVGTYIHLNPLRAGMLAPTRPVLERYRWSSYPEYLKPPSKRIGWLRTEALLGSWHISRDDALGRQRFAMHMKGVMADWLSEEQREELQEDWMRLRRGWYVGSGSFRDRLLDEVAEAMQGKLRSSYDQSAAAMHDERAAEMLLEYVCDGMDWRMSELRGWKKRDERKMGICWLLKSRTTVTDRWICQHLEMGHRNNVSYAVKVYREQAGKEIRGLRTTLEELCNIAH